jgi:hypothetical protein
MKKGLQPNYYWATMDDFQIPVELDQVGVVWSGTIWLFLKVLVFGKSLGSKLTTTIFS